MRHSKCLYLSLFATVAIAGVPNLPAQQPAAAAAPPSFVLTVQDKKGKPVAAVSKDDVIVTAGKTTVPVKAVVPLQGNDARMELYIVLDDDIPNFATYMVPVREFVSHLPNTTVVGVAYLHTGGAQIGIALNLNHGAVAQSMRAPSGQSGVSQSPFESISDLIKQWPQRPNRRREMVIFSQGVEGFGENNSDNPLVKAAIEAAQGSGIVVYCFTTGGAGTSTAAPLGSRTGAALGSTMNDSSPALDSNIGGGHLADLANKTGGDVYIQGTPLNVADELDEITARMQAQFRVELDTSGLPAGLTPVKVAVRQANVKVSAPTAITIP